MEDNSLVGVEPLSEVLVGFVFYGIKWKVEYGMVSLENFFFVGVHDFNFSHNLVMES